MKTTEPKSSSYSALQRSNTPPFFQPEESREEFFSSPHIQSPFFKPFPTNENNPSPVNIQPKLTIGAPNNIQRQEFGDRLRLNSLSGQPPRAEVYGPMTDEAIAMELYEDLEIPIVYVPDTPMIIFVDYSRLRSDRKALFEASELTTTDFLLTQIESIGTGQGRATVRQRREAALELANIARAEITNPSLIDAYLQRTDIANEEKSTTLGQLVVLHGKIEFLLGWIYEGGVQNSNGNGFENSGSNTGDFPNLYQEKGGGVEEGGGYRWCTSFAGYLYGTLGLVPNEVTDSNAFLSGYRLRKWATSGQDNDDNQVTAQDQTLEARAGETGSGSALIDRSVWRQLRRSLESSRRSLRPELIDTFFTNHPVPQAGDILLIGGEGNDFQSGHSHTVIVESYNPEARTITTIEGNVNGLPRGNNGISTRIINLTNLEDLDEFIMLARPGIQFANIPEGPPAMEVSDFELIQPLASVITRLVTFASATDRYWICSSDPNASVQEWMYGPLCPAL